MFEVPFVKRYTVVSFVAGQPLGYYASWLLFAFSHHILVWWCAEQIYPGRVFRDYAVLGDDVVIADERVAQVYADALSKLGVTISHAKSLISHRGAAEFAKRFRVRNLTVDLSPVSASACLNCHHPYGAMAVHSRYHCQRFTTLLCVG